jgi:predicted transcriptional regulator of viral defense system
MTIAAVREATVRAPQAADWALSHGVGSMTTAEVAVLLGVPVSQVPQRLAVPKKRGEWITPARGLWVPVPPEFRAWGGPPAAEFIAALTAHVGVTYYIGWLAAAAVHGAAHHAPQVTHVAVSRLVRDRRVGRADLRFHTRSQIDSLPTVSRMARSGAYLVSSPEVTALDVASDIGVAGGLDNAATVIAELADEPGLDATLLAGLARLFPDAAGRRVGWMVETFAGRQFDELAATVARGSASPARLHPSRPWTGDLDGRWRLRLNATVEVE